MKLSGEEARVKNASVTRRWNLQRVKDAEVLKCWRRRMRGLQQDSIWKSVPEHLRPGAAHYTMTNEPHGTGDALKKEPLLYSNQSLQGNI